MQIVEKGASRLQLTSYLLKTKSMKVFPAFQIISCLSFVELRRHAIEIKMDSPSHSIVVIFCCRYFVPIQKQQSLSHPMVALCGVSTLHRFYVW